MKSKDRILIGLGIVSLTIGILMGIGVVREIGNSTTDYPLSIAAINVISQVATGILLIYQEGKGTYYWAITAAIVSGITALQAPYTEFVGFAVFSFIVALVIFLRRRVFEKIS